MKIDDDVSIEVIDDREYLKDNPNYIPQASKTLEDMSEEERKTYYALRAKKGVLTRKANISYKYNVRRCAQALMDGVFDTLKDGSQITGAELLTINAFERAKNDDKALTTFLKLTGDLKENVEVSVPSYEAMIKKTKTEW